MFKKHLLENIADSVLFVLLTLTSAAIAVTIFFCEARDAFDPVCHASIFNPLLEMVMNLLTWLGFMFVLGGFTLVLPALVVALIVSAVKKVQRYRKGLWADDGYVLECARLIPFGLAALWLTSFQSF